MQIKSAEDFEKHSVKLNAKMLPRHRTPMQPRSQF